MFTDILNFAMDVIQLGADILCFALDMLSDSCEAATKTATTVMKRAQNAAQDLTGMVDCVLDIVEFVLETTADISVVVIARLMEMWEVFLESVPEVVIELARAITPIVLRFAASALV